MNIRVGPEPNSKWRYEHWYDPLAHALQLESARVATAWEGASALAFEDATDQEREVFKREWRELVEKTWSEEAVIKFVVKPAPPHRESEWHASYYRSYQKQFVEEAFKLATTTFYRRKFDRLIEPMIQAGWCDRKVTEEGFRFALSEPFRDERLEKSCRKFLNQHNGLIEQFARQIRSELEGEAAASEASRLDAEIQQREREEAELAACVGTKRTRLDELNRQQDAIAQRIDRETPEKLKELEDLQAELESLRDELKTVQAEQRDREAHQSEEDAAERERQQRGSLRERLDAKYVEIL